MRVRELGCEADRQGKGEADSAMGPVPSGAVENLAEDGCCGGVVAGDPAGKARDQGMRGGKMLYARL